MILQQTKFLVPRIPPARVARPHLNQLIADHLRDQIVTLIAPPGYGKTVLMADAARSLDRPLLWYQLDDVDNDPAVFVANLTGGIGQVLPEHGSEIRALLSEAGTLPPERALTVLLNHLAAMPAPPWLLVLDDYHVIANMAVHQLTTTLVERGPASMGVMLASRSVPPLPMSRWRAEGRLFQVTTEQLRFSAEEYEHWLAQERPDLPGEVAAQLIARTEGWGAGLQLALSLLEDDPAGALDLPDWLEGGHQHIFNYLMDEVFSRQPDDLQEFLLTSCVLLTMDVEACQKGLGISGARALIDRVEQSNLFLVSLDAHRKYYRYHQLFREFLLERLAQEDPERLQALQISAARLYEARGDSETAISCYLQAGDLPQAARVLAAVAGDWLQQGRIDALHRAAIALEAVLDEMPALLLAHGRALRLMGRFNEARLRLDRAATLARQAEDSETASSAWMELSSLARSQGDYAGAQTQAQRALDVLGDGNHTARAFALMELAKSRGFLEGMDLGRTLASEAVAEMELAGSQISRFEQAQLLRSLAQICWWHGDVQMAIAHGEDALNRIPVPQSPLAAEILLTLATPCLYRHEIERAYGYAISALAICEQLVVKELLPTALTTLGNILTRMGRLDDAEVNLHRAIELASDLGVARYAQVMAAGYLAYAQFMRGRVQEAIQTAETALWSYEGLPVVYEVYVCRSVLADSYLSDGQTLKAERIFESLLELGERRQYRIPLAMVYFGLAYIRLKAGNREQGIALAERSLDYLQPSRAWELFVDQGERAQVVCSALAERQPENAFVRQVLSTLTPAPAAAPPVVQVTCPKLAVQTLGGFRVFRDGIEIPPRAWVSTKARDLLAYFITCRGEVISLDVALEAVWSGDGDRAASAFHTALYRLRSALQTKDDRPKYVTVEAGQYALDESRFDIDVDRFDARIAAAAQATPMEAEALLQQAVSLYKGPYLDSFWYAWVSPEQERLRETFCRALSTLEQYSVERCDFDGALGFARQRLQADPLQEASHRAVMRYMAQLGDRAGVLRQYRQLQALFREELGVEPSAATGQLVRELTNGALD